MRPHVSFFLSFLFSHSRQDGQEGEHFHPGPSYLERVLIVAAVFSVFISSFGFPLHFLSLTNNLTTSWDINATQFLGKEIPAFLCERVWRQMLWILDYILCCMRRMFRWMLVLPLAWDRRDRTCVCVTRQSCLRIASKRCSRWQKTQCLITWSLLRGNPSFLGCLPIIIIIVDDVPWNNRR